MHDSKFPAKIQSEAIAQKTAALGFNLVRLHHLDNPRPGYGIFDQEQMTNYRNTLSLDRELMDRMDYFIHCLCKNGVYIYFDGITLRKFLANDGVPSYDNLTDGIKGSAFVINNKILQEKQKEYFLLFWNHYNPYRKMKYKDDPAIIMSSIINESDLFTHGNLNHHFPEPYRNDFMSLWTDWSVHSGIKSTFTEAETHDTAHFKVDIMSDYFSQMKVFLQNLKPGLLVCGTTWFYKYLALHKSYLKMDYIATHGHFSKSEYLMDPQNNKTHPAVRLSIARQSGKPLIHEEWGAWNGMYDRSASIAFRTACISMLDHEGSIYFAMYHAYKAEPQIFACNAMLDPAKSFIFPVLNLMLLRRDLQINPRKIMYLMTDDLLYGNNCEALTIDNICKVYPGFEYAGFYGRAEMTLSIPQKYESNTVIIKPGETAPNLPDKNTYPLISGSGEVINYYKDKYFLVRNLFTKIAAGHFCRKGEIDLGNGISVYITNTDYACIAVSSLDAEPIHKSQKIMLTAISYVETEGQIYDRDWLNPIDYVKEGVKILAQPVKGCLSIINPENSYICKSRTLKNSDLKNNLIKGSSGKIIIPMDGSSLVYIIEKISK